VHLFTGSHFRSRDKHDGQPFDPPYPKNPMLHADVTALCYRSGVIADRSLTLQEYGFSTFIVPVALTLTRWPSYANLTRILWECTGCVWMNFLRQGFRKLSSDRQSGTDRTAGGQKCRRTVERLAQVVTEKAYPFIERRRRWFGENGDCLWHATSWGDVGSFSHHETRLLLLSCRPRAPVNRPPAFSALFRRTRGTHSPSSSILLV